MSNDITALADFENGDFGRSMIEEWADVTGGLPAVSAHAFAQWLDGAWNDYNDESGTQTNEDVLKGALAYWRGDA